MMKIPLGLDIVPVNGWQARLNRQGRDLIIEEKKQSENFTPGRERRQGRRPSCPTWWSECEKGEGGKDADMIVEVNCWRHTRYEANTCSELCGHS